MTWWCNVMSQSHGIKGRTTDEVFQALQGQDFQWETGAPVGTNLEPFTFLAQWVHFKNRKRQHLNIYSHPWQYRYNVCILPSPAVCAYMSEWTFWWILHVSSVCNHAALSSLLSRIVCYTGMTVQGGIFAAVTAPPDIGPVSYRKSFQMSTVNETDTDKLLFDSHLFHPVSSGNKFWNSKPPNLIFFNTEQAL